MWQEDVKDFDGDFQRLADTFEWRAMKDGADYGITITIKVWELQSGSFLALPSHQVQSPTQASPYASLNTKPSVKAALGECIDGFMMFMESPQTTKWPAMS